MNCKNCGAPMKVVRDRGYFVCEYCTSFYFPSESKDGVRVLGEASHFECPVCHEPLVSAVIDEVDVLHCNKCQGTLAKPGKFVTIVKSRRARASGPPAPPRPLNREELKRQVYCPSCHKLMETYPYCGPGNVVIDSCGRCSLLWLDHSEISIIVDAPRRDRGGW